MKKAMMLMFLVPLLACAQMNITTNERVSKEMIPDVLSGSIHFYEEGKNSNVIKEHLNEIVVSVKQFDSKNEFCKGGGYNISPRYTEDRKNKQEFIAYDGRMSFYCKFSSIEQYNTLIASIQKVKAQGVRIEQGSLSWIVNPKIRQDTYLELRSSLLKVANNQAQIFSKETKIHCEVSSVNFDGRSSSQQRFDKGMKLSESSIIAKNESIPTEAPVNQNEELSIDAIVNYTCTNK